MKLLCVNNKEIISRLSNKHIIHGGHGLIEGKIYETKGKEYKDEHGIKCYYIEGLGNKLACRFTELLNEYKEEIKESNSIKEQIATAIANENYELADKLTKESNV